MPPDCVDKHARGATSEAVVAQALARAGFHIFHQIFRGTGPVDLIAVHPESKDVLMVDVKSASKRALPNRPNTYRINRVRSDIQKALGVHFCYVEKDGSLRFIPKLSEQLSQRLDQ